MDQGHLSPLPLAASPVYWQHDHALRLYPFLNALIAGDRVDQYYKNYKGYNAINLGHSSENQLIKAKLWVCLSSWVPSWDMNLRKTLPSQRFH